MKTLLRFGHLASSEEARLNELLEQWSGYSRSTTPIDRQKTELAVQRLYAWFGKAPAKIIWCASPWQMASLYMLVRLGYVSGLQPDLPEPLRSVREQIMERFSEDIAAGSVSDLLTLRFFPTGELNPHGVFFQGRLPCMSPKLKPAGCEFPARNLIGFTRSLTMDVGYSGRVKLRRCTEWFLERGGNWVVRQMLAGWTSKLTETFADSRTQAAVRDFLSVWNTGFRLPWPLLTFYNQHRDIAFAEAAAMVPNLIWFASWSSEWLPIYDFLLESKNIFDQAEVEELSNWLVLARNATAYSFFDQLCLVSERPTAIHCDAEGRLDSRSSAALAFADGYKIYSWQGVTCPKDLIEHPEKITPQEIDQEGNAEIKRIMIERFGLEKYVTSSFDTKIHEDECGTLYSKRTGVGEPLTMVRVTNSTPESNGTYKEYFLRVPPTMKTAREAVAWTFDLDEEEYDPSVQT